MGKITKTIQSKHEETQSPWVKDFVQSASSTPLPLLPRQLATFPTRWPFPRGDLYHWIPLLNRFDNILECFSATYKLGEGPQSRDFGCDLLLNQGTKTGAYGEETWDINKLRNEGYGNDGDRELVETILKFTRVLLEHCGNRSIYASSSHLNDLLNSTCLSLLVATLEVGSELAKRYQASVKRIGTNSRHVNTALLANHYNIDLDRVQQLAAPFVKTPLVSLSDPHASSTTPASAKGKEKVHVPAHKNAAAMFANDLGAIVNSDAGRWQGWGDVKITYSAPVEARDHQILGSSTERPGSSLPASPTPLRRSTTVGVSSQQTPRSARQGATDDTSPTTNRSPATARDQPVSGQRVFDLPQSVVANSSVHQLLTRCPADLPPQTKYEVLNRLRIAKALLGDTETRQQALAVRLLAITNLAYVHQEATFTEKVLRPDIDETRRFQLVYQLAELIHPTSDGSTPVPLWLQAIALALLEAVSAFQARYQDVLSALNANVNHGILLYVVRKAVASMKEDDPSEQGNRATELDDWRKELFSLTQHLAMSTRIGVEMVGAGLMDVLVEILKIRTRVAERNQATTLSFIDGLIWSYQNAFQAFFNGDGLDAVSDLLVTSVSDANRLTDAGQGTKSEFHSSIVDYDLPFHQQQTLKWLLKFMHHMMTNSYSIGGNTDRLLRNLVDKSDLLAGLRDIMQHTKRFGAVLWTNAITVLSDFINNDPTSYAAIAESRLISGFIESITGRSVSEPPAAQRASEGEGEEAELETQAPDQQEIPEPDGRPHPPPDNVLASEKDRPLAREILASQDAILVIPQVLNSISLNNAGLKMVISSRAFDTFFEMFESPKHVKCLEGEHHLASSVGESFDELARHHPALRNAISDSVIDMTARVRFLGIDKARTGWGVKLTFTDAAGNLVTADDQLIDHLSGSATSTQNKGKAKATSDDTDVEMADTSRQDDDKIVTSQQSPSLSTVEDIKPYVHALSLFLQNYISNSTLKANFIQRGGIELLLDVAELPSLPADFVGSAAGRKLHYVIGQLIEHSPVVGLPSLLKRTQAVIESLSPYIETREERPYFHPFVSSDKPVTEHNIKDWDANTKAKALTGTKTVKALLNAQSFLKILHECFTTTTRSSAIQLFPVNVFDYYLQVVRSLGPLVNACLMEEGDVHSVVPQHWWARGDLSESDTLSYLLGRNSAPDASPSAEGNDPSMLSMFSGSSENVGSAGANPPDSKSSETTPKRPSKQEQSTARYKNFETIRTLVHSVVPSVFPFFQQLGKALLPRRDRDLFTRRQHVEIAKALATTLLDQLRPSVAVEHPDAKDYHYWIIMLHAVGEMMLDTLVRPSDRSGGQIIMSVYLAFVDQGGLHVLTTLARRFCDELQKPSSGAESGTIAKVCSFGLKRLLDLFSTFVDGKTVGDSAVLFGLLPRISPRRDEANAVASQIILEARAAILPVVRDIWDSPLIEKSQPGMLTKVVDILKIISKADNEPDQHKPLVADALNTSPTPFRWQPCENVVSHLSQTYGEDLAQEAVYRANGNQGSATEYCRMLKDGKAGARKPIPSEDVYTPTAAASSGRPGGSANATSSGPEPMAVDTSEQLDNLIGDAVLGELEDNSADDDEDEDDDDDDDDTRGESQASAGETLRQTTEEGDSRSGSKRDLDSQREQMRKELIARSLDIVRAHPHAAIEVSELINTMVFNRQDHEIREEVGTTLASAITSLSFVDAEYNEQEPDGNTIAAYSHLFALLLREKAFLECNIANLRSNVDAYIGFLKVTPSKSQDELPLWIPYVLLIVEILLSRGEMPVESTWKAPSSDSDTVQQPVLKREDPILTDDQNSSLLDSILDLLPRLGKDDTLSISVLRVLVMLTRKRALARQVGEKKNLQRLFVMAKQLASGGAHRLKDTKTAGCIMIILRHVVEDEETIKQVMRSQIRQLFDNPQRTQRQVDLGMYLRNLAPVALRSPELFIEVTNELTKLTRWSPINEGSSRAHQLALKGSDENLEKAPGSDESVEPAVQATEDLSLQDVKQSTEGGDKEMLDAPKPTVPRPVVENPDGVVHFLLCELLNYREVDDNENPPSKDNKDGPQSSSSGSPSQEAAPGNLTVSGSDPPPATDGREGKDAKDKKAAKPSFKAEEHPIFIYRCFILNCLSELLQSYNRTKVEFINFKRSAPLQTNTPVKPRSSVLNYLIHDVLCQGNVTENADNVLAKKKVATANQAQQVLVSLVTRTGERTLDKTRERFEYDDDPELLFVRKFALDTILKAYERASSAEESFEVRYSKMQSLAELMNHIIGEKERDPPPSARGVDGSQLRSQAQLRRMMYEKGYLDKLTSSIADLDLSHAGVKRAVKYVLRVLRVLTDTAKDLSRSNVIPFAAVPDGADDEIASSSSMSDLDDDREETPDLYRNSALGMLEPRGSDDESEDDEDDDEEMYDDGYGDSLEYDEEELSEDGDDGVSDDEEEELGEMGEIEGLHGEPGMVEVVMDEDEDMDEDDDELSEDELGSDDMEDVEDDVDVVEEIVDEDGNPLDDDGHSGWESDTDDDADEHDEPEEDEEIDYEAEAQDLDEAHMHGMEHGDIIDNLARAVMNPDDFDPEDMDDLDNHYLDEGRGEEDDEEDEEMDEDDYIYDDDYPRMLTQYEQLKAHANLRIDDEPAPVGVPGSLGWDTLIVEPFSHRHGHRPHSHGHRSPFPPGFMAAGGPRDPLGGMSPASIFDSLSVLLSDLDPASQGANSRADFRSYFSRRHRSNAPPNNADDGVNPLLRRSNQESESVPPPHRTPGMVGLRLPTDFLTPGGGGGRGNLMDNPMALLNDIVAHLPVMRHGPGSVHLQISPHGRGGEVREVHHPRPGDSRVDARRDGTYQEPQQAVAFNTDSTFERYSEEGRVVLGGPQFADHAQRLINLILHKLVPPAMERERKLRAEEEERRRVREEERKKKEEEARRAREAKEAEERAERERKEAEERAARERAAAEAPSAQGADAAATHSAADAESQAMEGVEAHDSAAAAGSQPAADIPRVTTTIRGEEVDITELGIDPEYLAALPDEFREEVIAQTVSSRRSQAREEAATGEQTEVFQEFLDALPDEIRSEIVQQERQETRRREREEHRRQAAPGQDANTNEMDASSILLTFPPELRQQVLMEQGPDLIDQLTPDMAAQVRLSQRADSGRSPQVAARRTAPLAANAGEDAANKAQRKTVVQMLDKAGIATLLRLMFISQQGSIRNHLFNVLADVCENRQNRLEVVSTILLILQEGSTDMQAVERSFSQLSLKAKRPKDRDADPKTPTQNLKRTLTSLTAHHQVQTNSEISPLLVVHQCLDLLQELSTKNPHIPMLFLSEHETVGSSLRRSLSKKGKTKESKELKETKSHKYAVNSLLTLLDRDLVMDSSVVMAYLADLLNKITVPLATMDRRRREVEEKAEKAAAEAKKAIEEGANPAGEASSSAIPAATEQQATVAASGDSTAAETAPVQADQKTSGDSEKTEPGTNKVSNDAEGNGQQKERRFHVPVIPQHNLTLVIKVFVARECSSKTFQNTISAIKNLSVIPGAKAIFGQELVRQAQVLSENIVSDLDELLPHILQATSGTEIQGVALSKFSPGASEQNKLLRVLTALDHLFDTKKKRSGQPEDNDNSNEKQDLVHSLYYNSTFSKMWEKLSSCLGAIRQRENMVNVATILLPLIESLMVVCKNTSSTEAPTQPEPEKEMLLSSPPPESRMAGLFFNFTEDHRRILNELVRNNPKLMSGTFSLLVKNPKVLEFDNKRNYFNRSVHSRANAQRPSFPSLQLAVRREHVFHDSYRALYFKSGEEMKHGKLNIRFHGEEGVDAGGVTREWFQVLARQMFDANYALFTPVSSDRTTFHPNKLSGINEMHLAYFKFVGRVIGKALYEGRVIDCYFSRAVYKRILGKSVSVKDMESFDPDYYKSLVWMLENDITDIITETFSVEDDEFGVTNIVDLCPDGRNIPVTQENKHDYVRLVVEHRLLSSVKDQMENFLKGFHEIIPAHLISIFNEQELELLISGLPDIDVDDWKSNTEYHNYTPSSQQIQWFWRALRSFDKEELAKLLQFVTGTSKVPLNGFKELEGMNGINRFNIHRDYGNKERLPSSHTCFNQLDLPEYESYDALRAQLLKAITAGSEYFGFA